jgi:hypothetical protein
MSSLAHFMPLSSTTTSQPQLPPHVRLKHIRQQRHQHRHHATRVSLLQQAPTLLRQEVAVQTQHQLHQLHVTQRLQQRLQLIGGNGRQNVDSAPCRHEMRVEGRRWGRAPAPAPHAVTVCPGRVGRIMHGPGPLLQPSSCRSWSGSCWRRRAYQQLDCVRLSWKRCSCSVIISIRPD